MRLISLTIFLILFTTINLVAQLIAGSTIGNSSITYPNINLINSTIDSALIDSIDIDCDGVKDLQVKLVKWRCYAGSGVDCDNEFVLSSSDTGFHIGITRNSIGYRVNYYNSGDTIIQLTKLSSQETNLGMFQYNQGGEPFSMTNGYFAYVKNTSLGNIWGWIKVSFNLNDGTTSSFGAGNSVPISATIHEVLSFCQNQTNISKLINNENQLIIYPNPSSNNFTIEIANTRKGSVQVYDLNDKLLINQNVIGRTTINVENLVTGLYKLVVKTDNNLATKKLVIIK